jgi:small subunit ribosomal protein S21
VAEVVVKDFDSFETALRRFKKKVQDAGLLQEMRKREYFEAPSVRRKKKVLAAIRKERRRQKRENEKY